MASTRSAEPTPDPPPPRALLFTISVPADGLYSPGATVLIEAAYEGNDHLRALSVERRSDGDALPVAVVPTAERVDDQPRGNHAHLTHAPGVAAMAGLARRPAAGGLR